MYNWVDLMERKIDLINLLLDNEKMESFEDLIAHLIPSYWSHQKFSNLEKAYLRLKIKDDAFTDIKTYMKVNNISSRKTIYNQISKKTLLTKKIGKYIFVKDYRD